MGVHDRGRVRLPLRRVRRGSGAGLQAGARRLRDDRAVLDSEARRHAAPVPLMLAVLPIAAALVPVPAGVVAGFEMPSGNIDCNAGPYHGKPLLAFTVFSLEDPKRGQKVWALPATGRVSVGFVLGNAA